MMDVYKSQLVCANLEVALVLVAPHCLLRLMFYMSVFLFSSVLFLHASYQAISMDFCSFIPVTV